MTKWSIIYVLWDQRRNVPRSRFGQLSQVPCTQCFPIPIASWKSDISRHCLHNANQVLLKGQNFFSPTLNTRRMSSSSRHESVVLIKRSGCMQIPVLEFSFVKFKIEWQLPTAAHAFSKLADNFRPMESKAYPLHWSNVDDYGQITSGAAVVVRWQRCTSVCNMLIQYVWKLISSPFMTSRWAPLTLTPKHSFVDVFVQLVNHGGIQSWRCSFFVVSLAFESEIALFEAKIYFRFRLRLVDSPSSGPGMDVGSAFLVPKPMCLW